MNGAQAKELLRVAPFIGGESVTLPPVADDRPDFEGVVKRLAALSPLECDHCIDVEAEILGVKRKTLEAVVKAARKESATAGGIPDVEPWPYPVDPAALLTEIETTIQRFIICNRETATAAALWVAMTWFVSVLTICPLAVISAPEKRCGKSTLLALLAWLVRRALPASNITPAALFRTVEAWRPTLLLDEVDAFLRENEDLRGLLNAGHTRYTAFVIRLVGDQHEPKRFDVFGPKLLAGIGKLHGTLIDRAVVLPLRRKLPHENVERLRYAPPELFERLSRQLARFADDHAEAVRAARPEIPEILHDRAADNASPLLAIADIAGGKWPAMARHALVVLSAADDTESTGGELLADIREIFSAKGVEKIFSAELVKALVDDPEAGWNCYNRGRPITPRQVAKKLSEYSITPHLMKVCGDAARGYRLDQFQEAFKRYLPPVAVVNESLQNILDLTEGAPEWRAELLNETERQ